MVGARHTGGPLVVLLLASWPAVALFVIGTVFVALLLLYFLEEERYRRPPGPERGVEFVAARRAVEAQLSALAPKVVLLAEKERGLAGRLKEGALDEQTRRTVDALLRDAASGGFWEGFVGASALAETDPVSAHRELRLLSATAETALEKLRRAEDIARGGEDAGAPDHG